MAKVLLEREVLEGEELTQFAREARDGEPPEAAPPKRSPRRASEPRKDKNTV